jgi:hypothetical protein
MKLNNKLKLVKLHNLGRMMELKRNPYKSKLEWEEYHLLKHKYEEQKEKKQ